MSKDAADDASTSSLGQVLQQQLFVPLKHFLRDAQRRLSQPYVEVPFDADQLISPPKPPSVTPARSQPPSDPPSPSVPTSPPKTPPKPLSRPSRPSSSSAPSDSLSSSSIQVRSTTPQRHTLKKKAPSVDNKLSQSPQTTSSKPSANTPHLKHRQTNLNKLTLREGKIVSDQAQGLEI
ncbi:MAG: hypothetical protein VW378_06915 [bacterium]